VERQKSNWTPERDEELRKLWPVLSAARIAAAIGTSRSAVLGRYHRLWGNGEHYKQTQKAKGRGVRALKRPAQIAAVAELGRNLAQGMDRRAAVIAARDAGAPCQLIADALGMSKAWVHKTCTAKSRARLAIPPVD
jgi:hypothetical protein